MPIATAAPAYANVAFLRIPEFDGRPVAEQARLKEWLEDRARLALAGLPLGDRVVLDAPDGLALLLFGDPARALEIAQGLRTGSEPPLHVGLNYGPVALTSRGADAHVFGDGLAEAAAAARFSTPEQLFVTSGFAKALEATAPVRAADLAPAGEYTDTRVRLHSFYTPVAKRGQARRHRLAAYALTGVLAILLLGVAGREAQRRFFPPAPASIALEVKPRGEVFVDGITYGSTPPLDEIEIPPGRHSVQIRHAGFPPLEVSLSLEPGERVTINHSFATVERRPAAKKAPAEKTDLWRDLRRRFGL